MTYTAISRELMRFAPTGTRTDRREYRRAQQAIAAAISVVGERGPAWCLEDPQRFRSEIIKTLGLLVRIGLAIASLFGGGVWTSVLSWLMPALINFLTHSGTSTLFRSREFWREVGTAAAKDLNRKA